MIPIPDACFRRIGRTVAERRRQLGLSQQSLAERLEISPTHMCRVESGMRPGLELLVSLARVLGLSLDELFRLEPARSDSLSAVTRLLSARPEADRRLALVLLQSFFLTREAELSPRRSLPHEAPPYVAEKTVFTP